jgi:hypothetical protein
MQANAWIIVGYPLEHGLDTYLVINSCQPSFEMDSASLMRSSYGIDVTQWKRRDKLIHSRPTHSIIVCHDFSLDYLKVAP